MTLSIKGTSRALDNFFFKQVDLRALGVIRILFAFFLLLNMLNIAPDLLIFFGPNGLVDIEAGRGIVDKDVVSIFDFLPLTDATVQVVFCILIYSIVALGVGFFSRFHALLTFILYTSFIHRNVILFDGEDVVFRMFCFFLVLSPAGSFYSIFDLFKKKFDFQPRIFGSAWHLRLFQIQMTLIYFSTSWEKMKGKEWLDGTAMYYIFRLEEFVRFPIPEVLYSNIHFIQFLTWSTVAVEAFLPLALWIKETRFLAIFLGVGLHLAIEYQMNLNMFQWIMITGLVSFIKIEEDGNFIRRIGNSLRRGQIHDYSKS